MRAADDVTKRVLTAVLAAELEGEKTDVASLASRLGLPESVMRDWLLGLESEGLVEKTAGGYKATEAGRRRIKIVLAGGVFDIIHPGHIYTLEKSKSLGDMLVVVVARDSTAEKMKGSKPMHNEDLRVKLVSSLKPVDAAILGSPRDVFETVERVRPDIIALGYDQAHKEDELLAEGRKRGLIFKVVRLNSPYPHIKSRAIKLRLAREC